MGIPTTPEEYQQQLQNRLNWFEKLTQDASSLDERIDVTNHLLMEMVRLLGGIGENGTAPSVKAWPDNADLAYIASVDIAVADTPYQLPSIPIPSGFDVVIKSWPDNGGTIYVAFNAADCVIKSLSWPLLQGEFVAWQLKNTDSVYVSSTAAGDKLVVTAERRL